MNVESRRLEKLRAKGRAARQGSGAGLAVANGRKRKEYDSASRYEREPYGNFGLTRRQAMYVLEYISDPSSQTQAAIAAGYSPQSAAQAATQLMKTPKVKRAIEQLQERLRENTEITAEAVLKRLADIAFDTRPKPRSADQVKALELMSKWLGLDIPDSNMHLELVVRYESERESQIVDAEWEEAADA